MMVNFTRGEADAVARILDAFAATSPEDEWTPDAQTAMVKLWRGIERADDARDQRVADLGEEQPS